MKVLKVLGISGSLRKASTNTGILRYIKSQAPALGMEMEIAELKEIPFYNGDLETQKDDNKPPALQKLLEQMRSADAYVLATPEYNYSYAPALKNALDWGSREKGNIFEGKPASLVSSGGGMRGGRSQYHIRQVGVFLDLHILNKPEVMFSAFDGSFDEEGNLINEQGQERCVSQLKALRALSMQLNAEIVEPTEMN